MKRSFALAAALLAAFVFTTSTAEAGGRNRISKEVKVAAIVTGAAATVTYFSLNAWNWRWDNPHGMTSLAAYGVTTMGCIAVAPMVATVLAKRPMTMREGHILAGSCVVPIIGGYLVNAAYNNNPQWEAGDKPVKVKKAKKKK